MKIATWNVNSLKVRMPHVEEWIAEQQPDVLVLQETKLADAVFPSGAFQLLGYEGAHHGNGRWNGVAILSRVGLEDVRAGFHDDDESSIDECRIISATCGGVRVFSVYVPNGRIVDSEHYVAKLEWLGKLRDELAAANSTEDSVAVLGDFNIAPEDRDVWDPAAFVGQTHVTEPERAALRELLALGFVDSMRLLNPDEPGPFTWWDYRAGSFHKGQGMRIDLALVSAPLAKRLTAAYRDRDARKGKLPSDHAPVVIELAEGA